MFLFNSGVVVGLMNTGTVDLCIVMAVITIFCLNN